MRLIVAQPSVILHGSGVALSCGIDGMMAGKLHGLFVIDTRMLATYELTLGGAPLEMLSRASDGHGLGRWYYQNCTFESGGVRVRAGSVLVILRRRVDGALHDDLQITSFLHPRLQTTLGIHLATDFADIFEVKEHEISEEIREEEAADDREPTRGGEPTEGPDEPGAKYRRREIRREVRADGLAFHYEHDGVQRSLHVTVSGLGRRGDGDLLTANGSRLEIDLELDHAATASFCLEAVPEIQWERQPFCGDPHGGEAQERPPLHILGDSLLVDPLRRGCADLDSLTMTIKGGTFVAAGVPWFLTLFGRDTLTTSLMTGLVGTTTAQGTLAALGRLQATEVDDWRDAEPGKIPHELRRGELAQRGRIPHTPYYGSHDTQSLYCLALWNTWRWTGDQSLLEARLPTARAALEWCDHHGDRDHDGLQEYATRSPVGYYNQSWKDAGDAIVTAEGEIAPLPLATVELQGYLFAARLAMAELFEVCGHHHDAEAERRAASALRDRVEEQFYLDREGFYALALDGTKTPLASIASNAGHLLWCGLPSPDRAAMVARRLMEPDLDSGWGLRTLSVGHPAFNPLSYQRGSVWPHDTVLAAAGMARYGHRAEAATLLRGLLDAARIFENDRLPELYCGLPRSLSNPVPYDEANTPQAWAAAVPILAAQLFLGLVPDAPSNRCFIDPWLPDWLSHLELKGIRVGRGHLNVRLDNRNGATTVDADSSGGLEVVTAATEAPLWGAPMTSAY